MKHLDQNSNHLLQACLASLTALVAAVIVTCGAWAEAVAQGTLTAQGLRGKQIYVQGTSASGAKIDAHLGDSSIEMPGSTMPCANCHGLDGHGKPEGGVTPSDLTWELLTKPYGVTHASGRHHPPYTEGTIQAAITQGKDPAGNKLLSVMPRYTMSREDLTDLTAYIEHLGSDHDPGISDRSIVIGTVIPTEGAMAEAGQAAKAITAAYFDEVNLQGGIYNRRIELQWVGAAVAPAITRSNLEHLLAEEPIFAITGAFIAGSENDMLPLIAQHQVPLIGPITLYPEADSLLNRQIFYLFSGLDGLARVFISFAAHNPAFRNPRVMMVYPQTSANAHILDEIEKQSRKEGLRDPLAYDYPFRAFDAARAVEQTRRESPDAVLFLGSADELLSFMKEAEKSATFPYIFLPGGIAGPALFDAPAGFSGKIFLSFPTSPADQSAEGRKEFTALAEKYKVPASHLPTQIVAYSAAKVLVEGLMRAGKDLSRESLIEALEGLYQYRTGLTPAITFGPNRRIGSTGGYVVKVDLKEKRFSPASGWINID